MRSNPHIPAAYLILRKDNQILLLRRYNTGFEDGNYSLIAGHVESGESFSACIIREAWEEAGIRVKAQDLRMVHLMHRRSHTPKDNQRVDVFFLAERWEGEITNKEPHKCDDLSWFDHDQLPDNMLEYILLVLDRVGSGDPYSEYHWDRLF